VEHRELPDGRFDLVLRGRYRARLQEEKPTGDSPFRMALLEPVSDQPMQDEEAEAQEAVEFLRTVLDGLVRQQRVEFMGEQCQVMAQQDADVAGLTDILAQVFCPNPYDLQGILEETNLGRRARLVEVQVRRELERKDAE
jgi:Lon protease-like protein